MNAIERIKKHNSIDKVEFDSISKLMFQSFQNDKEFKNENQLTKKEELLTSFTQFLEKYLELDLLNSKKEKLEIINFIDKMNMQKELLELQKGDNSISNIQIAADRLGKKSQSTFEIKNK
ncbi:hypothetical protein SAMN05444372_11712 [Flavobacterium micromati]|jgi:hypothetical protein|uniref:Uncharacterized protein n=1 Tax=Flavobacterium micromati TaxID=229205 RepID=A0A1M5QGW1_9FLAO|nr:hypothetical protein [Flavobacterium micromati]MCL6460512.1 hypothetical protein [Flavobacterium micromati]SHH13337.1 hypothetical protein SAMN05444372_11712 [Flavobacterium micromati]